MTVRVNKAKSGSCEIACQSSCCDLVCSSYVGCTAVTALPNIFVYFYMQ